MINNVFTDEERALLKSLKNKKFLSFEFGNFNREQDRIILKVRLNFEGLSFELYNTEEYVPYFGEEEDFSKLWLRKVDNKTPFDTQCEQMKEVRTVTVNDEVTSVEICEDVIRTVNEKDETEFDDAKLDKALIIRTKNNAYMFYTDWVCGEEICFCNHDDYEKCYPSEDIKESFGAETGYNVTLDRKRIII